MKRLISLCLVLSLFCLFGNTVLAVTRIEPTEENSKTFSISYDTQNKQNAGKQYVLLIVKQPKNSESGEEISFEVTNTDSILYMDQASADENGKVTFGPLQLKKYTGSNVYISGESTDGPVQIGYIKIDGVLVVGEANSSTSGIKFFGTSQGATVTLVDESGVEQAAFTTETDGSFSETVPAGVFDVIISKPGYCKITLKSINTEEGISKVDLTQCAGDLDGSGSINGTDLGIMLDNFNKSGSALSNQLSDLDDSGSVNGTDLGYLLDCFNKSNTVVTAD